MTYKMNIGDKVKLIHGKEEGIIRRIINDRLVEIEIEDGFLIPIPSNEIALISSGEELHYNANIHTSKKTSELIRDDSPVHNVGLFLALIVQDYLVQGLIINNTGANLMFSVHKQTTKGISGISHGILNPFSYASIEQWSLNRLHELPVLLIDMIQYFNLNDTYQPPITKKIDLNPKLLDQEKLEIPLLKSKGILIRLSDEPIVVDADALKQAMLSQKPKENIKDNILKKKGKEVDLHIEALGEDILGLGNAEILQLQLNHFEESLEKAVISGMDEITFIHGVGNGILRNKIHKKLSQYPHTKYFEDVMKEKFGYGATKVYLK